jgi:hypothetical protein
MSGAVTTRTAELEAAINGLVSCEHWPDATYVRLPLIYPGGSQVTVEVSMMPGGERYRVTDGGFSYQELEDIGAERSFSKTADAVAENFAIQKSRRQFMLDVRSNELVQAIADVGMASWQLVDRVYSRQKEEVDANFVDSLTERLNRIFHSPVETFVNITGASTTSWEMTALVRRNGERLIFQAVTPNGNSIHRANSAFDDLSELENPPRLIAVVPTFDIIGPKLKLLARHARVIPENATDESYLKVAA